MVKKKKVLVAGSFQIIHPGHIKLLEAAARLGNVWVVIARDVNVRKEFPVIVGEAQRCAVVESLKPVHRAVLGSVHDMLEPVKEIRPDIILLGPDQMSKDALTLLLRKAGLDGKIVVKRLKKRFLKHKLSSTSKIVKRILEKLAASTTTIS